MITVHARGVGGGRGSQHALVESLSTAPPIEGDKATAVAYIAG